MKPEEQVPRAFRRAAEFRDWLDEHHARARELLVRCWKIQSRRGTRD